MTLKDWAGTPLRGVKGLLSALRMHGVFGAAAKVLSLIKGNGLGAAFKRGAQTVRAHSALADNGSFGDNRICPIELHNAVLFDLGRRQTPRSPIKQRLVIIAETTLPQCKQYRIDNKIAALNAAGREAVYVNARDVSGVLTALQFASAVIFYRMQMTEIFMAYVAEAKRLGLSTYYDIDDPMFDRDAITTNDNILALDFGVRAALFRDALLMRNAMACCDCLLASTPALAQMMSAAANGKLAQVWRNVADNKALTMGAKITRTRTSGDKRVRIGLFSGSHAHAADFDLVSEPLKRLMDEDPKIDIALVGHFQKKAALERFGSRVFARPFSDYQTYLQALADCDLVVIPLLDNEFNRCKSIVRFIDAAIVGVPVIVSPVGDYAALVRHGDLGWLAEENTWDETLGDASADAGARKKMGVRARRYIEENFSVGSYTPDLGAKELSAWFV